MSENLPTKIDYGNAEVIKTLKATVAQGLTNEEFALFAQHCKGTGLNPFKKEVWAIKAGSRLQIMTGINGFLAIANSHPQFDGMEVEVDSDEKPTKAVCRVYRKDRKYPAEGVALLKEYGRDTPIWRQMPRVMLTKVAKSIALREAFPQELNGMYTAEEMPAEYSAEKLELAESVAPAQRQQVKLIAPGDHNPDEIMGFGKGLKTTWKDCPPDYLEWLHKNGAKKWGECAAFRAGLEIERRWQAEMHAARVAQDGSVEFADGDDLPDSFNQ